MEQCTIDFNLPIKLQKRTADYIGHMLHIASCDSTIFDSIIIKFTLESLCKLNHNGINSKLLEHYINFKPDQINILLHHITIDLMKRDILHLIKYYYSDSYELALDIFINTLLKKFELLQQDIDYILENKLLKLLPHMIGIFIKTSCNNMKYIVPHESDVMLYYLDNVQCENILDCIQSIINMKIIIKQDYGAIIDGGSVLHSNNGIITMNSLNELIMIANVAKVKCGRILVVIHRRHIKTFPNLESEFKKNDIDYFLTPYKMNDDLFILNFFLMMKTRPYIITNDKFRDHIFTFEKSKGPITNICMFKDVIMQQTIQFDISKNDINMKPKISYCIQKYKDNILVPHMNGNFIYIDN